MSRILIISSDVHKALAAEQRERCIHFFKQSSYDYQVEIAKAGTYEIPFIINTYHSNNPFDGYIALGLVLKTNPDHYDYIMSHIRTCFTHFALHHIIVGNGIVSGSSLEELANNVSSDDPCVSAWHSACHAVDYLINLKARTTGTSF